MHHSRSNLNYPNPWGQGGRSGMIPLIPLWGKLLLVTPNDVLRGCRNVFSASAWKFLRIVRHAEQRQLQAVRGSLR